MVFIAVILSCLTCVAHAQESLTLLKKYDLGSSRYSEGLDFYNDFLWHTTSQNLYKLDLVSATDTDGDNDHDLPTERTWILTHNNFSESSVWLGGELFNFTYFDTLDNPSDDIFRLDLNDDETYQWQHVGDGLGLTNWGSCRDRRNPGESIIYTGHNDHFLMWFEPDNGSTTHTLEIADLDAIEDLGMDRYGTVWASSFDSEFYPGLYRINPVTGEIVETFFGPVGLNVIDGIAIRSFGHHDVIYVTGKNTPFIWEYLVPDLAASDLIDDLQSAALELHPNYPNPFNPQTTISFTTGQPQWIRVAVCDIRGRRIAELVDQQYQAGEHSVVWRGRDEAGRNVPSGEYFFRFEFGGMVRTQKAVLLR